MGRKRRHCARDAASTCSTSDSGLGTGILSAPATEIICAFNSLWRKHRNSEQTAFGEGKRRISRDDEVIEHPDIDQGQGLLERLGQHLIGVAGLGYAGRMIVREDHCGRIVLQRALEYFARVYAGLD